MRIAHVVNPVKVSEDRDLHFQQPITFETLRRARGFATRAVDIELIAVCYEEDKDFVPDWFDTIAILKQEIGDYGKFKIYRKLPLFKEMIDRVHEVSDAEYIIQTNADIGLMPHFYLLVKSIINDGLDSFCINKRIMPEALNTIKALPLIWSGLGEVHAGHDCFVFKREIYPKFDMGKICMGTPWSEAVLITNLVAYAKIFQVFKNAHATFHLGDRRVWLPHDYNDYRINNTNEFARVLRKLSNKDKKILKHPTIRYLLEKLKTEVQGYRNEVYSEDCHYFV